MVPSLILKNLNNHLERDLFCLFSPLTGIAGERTVRDVGISLQG